MKTLSKHIKRIFILTALSCASVCIMPNILCDVMPVCTASEVSASDEERIIQEMTDTFKIADYQQKAKAGDVKAQLALAICYHDGNGIEQDNEKAFYWLTKAANQGYAPAQAPLAFCYQNGVGTKQD